MVFKAKPLLVMMERRESSEGPHTGSKMLNLLTKGYMSLLLVCLWPELITHYLFKRGEVEFYQMKVFRLQKVQNIQ